MILLKLDKISKNWENANKSYRKFNMEYKDNKLNTRIKIIGLWISLILLYIYCDIFTFFRPGQLNDMINGFMGPFPAEQIPLFIAGLLMVLPILIVIANLIIKMVAIKWINIIAGIVYTFVNIGNLIGEKWAYYFLYGIIEIIITISIIYISIKWPKNSE
jgi:hypothetical protein